MHFVRLAKTLLKKRRKCARQNYGHGPTFLAHPVCIPVVVDNPSLVDVVVSPSHQTHGPHVVLADAEHQLRIGTAPDKPVVIVAEQLQRRRRVFPAVILGRPAPPDRAQTTAADRKSRDTD